jgi:hypothetical protein
MIRRRLPSHEDSDMVWVSPIWSGLRYNVEAITPGAQTERQGHGEPEGVSPRSAAGEFLAWRRRLTGRFYFRGQKSEIRNQNSTKDNS